jgi:hypothetical protein
MAKSKSIAWYRGKADDAYSEYIRKRDGYCLYGLDTSDPCGGHIHCSHVISKGACSWLRYDERNAIGLCRNHHIYGWHSKNPAPYVSWYIKNFPEDWEYLQEQFRLYKQMSPEEKRQRTNKEYLIEIRKYYEQKLDYLRSK